MAVLGRAAARGVDVRGLEWHSNIAAVTDAEGDNAQFGARLRPHGVEAWPDMRVRYRGRSAERRAGKEVAGRWRSWWTQPPSTIKHSRYINPRPDHTDTPK